MRISRPFLTLWMVWMLASCGNDPVSKWNQVMAPEPEPPGLVMRVLTYQWGYWFQYPGKDGKLGKVSIASISDENPMGLDPSDPAGKDDFVTEAIVLPKGKEVDLRIVSRDVLHGIYIPHFRVKMEAIPGMETHIRFTPEFSTAEMRKQRDDLSFQYELACSEICGKGHFSHRTLLEVLESDEFNAWADSVSSK